MAYHSNGSGQQQQQQQQGQGGGGSLRGGGGGVGLSSGNRSGGPGSIGADYSGDERDSRSGIGGGGGGSGLDDRTIEHDLGDKPIYVLEHLATFTVNKESGIVYPADGMRRLLHLEKTTGIWSQKMQLCLDRQWILIMDYETGNIIERFPASMIQDPTPFTSNGPMEMYNNILVFIVAGGSGSRSEMHIFQCQSISAVHLAEDLKQLRNGKILTQHREIIQHQHQQQQSPSHQQQQQQQQMKSFHQQQQHQQQQNETDSEIGGINDETSSTSSEKYERDVTVLNHCFDDIEKFIARLQHAAAASRELERRRRNRKSKKKDPGEGLLTLRTKPPHEREFIDIFAKFKLSFNLLAKLKAHIHDPNAPELVHFLFTPLALIVDASHDTYYDPNLPARVINPLLTREAINLLINCVTSKETELWRSLGDAWTIPRDQWKGAGGNNAIMNVYHPVFFDGWSPDYPVIDDYNMDGGVGGNNNVVMMTAGSPTTHQTPNLKRRIDPIIAMQHQQQQQQQHPIQDYDYDTQMMGGGNSGGGGGGGGQQGIAAATAHRSPGSPGLLRDYSARSDISIDSIERNGGGGNGGGGVMTHHHIHHIQHQSGDMRNHDTNIILPMNSDQITAANNPNNNTTTTTDLWLDDLQGRGAKIVQVTYPRTANNDKELTVQRGEYLEILDDSRKWWKARNNRGQIAHVPHTIVTICNNNDTTNDVFNNPLYQQQQQNYNKNINRQESGVSDRYPPSSINENNNSIGGGGNGSGSVLPPTAPADWVRNKHIAQRNSYGSLSSDDGGGGGGLDIHHVREDYDMDTMQNQNRMMIIAGTPATANTTSIYRKHPQPPPAPQQRQSTAAIIHTRPISTSTTTTAAILLTNGNNSSNNNHNNNNNFNNAPPPPPPPPPLLTPVTPISNRSTSKNNTASRKSISSQGGAGGQDEMQEELKHVLTLFRDKRRTLDIIKTPEIFIQQSSSANEVEQWLKAKGFSDKVVKKLHGLNGNELFALKRPTLEDYCGAEEGKRLASQITIQRNVSGYKTARSSELQAILAKARKKTEEA